MVFCCIWGKLFLCIVFGCLYVYGFLLYLGVSGVSYFCVLFLVVCMCMVSAISGCICGKLFLCIVFGCLYVYGFLLYLG